MYHIADSYYWETHTIWSSCARIKRRWTGTAITSTKNIRADHKVSRSIDRSPRTNQWVPPSYLCVIWLVSIMCMRVPSQCMGNQNGIISLCIESTPRLVCQRDGADLTTSLQW